MTDTTCTAHDEAFEIANSREASDIFADWLKLTLSDPSTDPDEQTARAMRAEVLNQALTIQTEAASARNAEALSRARAGVRYQAHIEDSDTGERRAVNIAELFESQEDPALIFEPRPFYSGTDMTYLYRRVAA